MFKKVNFRDLSKIFFSKILRKVASDHFFSSNGIAADHLSHSRKNGRNW